MSVYREIRLFGKTVVEMSAFSGTVVAQESSTIHHGLQKKIVNDVSPINFMVVLDIFLCLYGSCLCSSQAWFPDIP